MLQRVIIFGAQSHFGMSLCERLLEEGIEVKGVFFDRGTLENRAIVEEHLMYIGRNALLEIHEAHYRESEKDNDADLVIYCGEDYSEDERKSLQESIKIANDFNHRFIYINSYTEKNECHEFMEIVKGHSIILLPTLLGPCQPHSNKINQTLVRFLDNEKHEIVIDDSLLFAKDAVEATYHLLGNIDSKFYTFSTDMDLNEKRTLPIRIIEDKEDLSEKIKGLCVIEVESSISIEEGLKEQISYLKKNNKV